MKKLSEIRSPLFKPNDDDSGGGGGGGGSDDDVSKKVTEMVTGAVARIEGTAIPNALKPVVKQVSELATNIAEVSESVKKLLEAQSSSNGDDDSGGSSGSGDSGGDAGSTTGKLEAELRRLRKQVDSQGTQLKEAQDDRAESLLEADRADRKAEVSRLLNSYTFVDESAGTYAREFVVNKVTRNDDKELVVGDITLAEFITQTMDGAFAGLLKAESGGSGQRSNGGGAGAGGRNKGVQIEAIGTDMSPEDRKAAWGEVGKVI